MGCENRLLTLAAITLTLPLLAACQPQTIAAQPAATATAPEASCQNQARNADFGFRSDLAASFMDLAAENSKIVRISYDNMNQIQFFQILQAAKNHCLSPLIVFNPKTYNADRVNEVQQKLTSLMEYARFLKLDDFAIELGNEPDDKKFWTGDFASFATFVKDTGPIVKDGGGKIVLAALVDPAKYADSYLKALHNQGVDLSGLIFGVHAYNQPQALIERTNIVRSALQARGVQNPKIWVTELGANDDRITKIDNRQNIIPLLETAKQLITEGKIERVYIHELPDTEGWGFVDYQSGKPNKFYDPVSSWLKQK